MPTFEEVAASWLEHNSTGVNYNLIFSHIGNIDIENLTSKNIQDCLIDLYDNANLRGSIFSSYEKFIADICQFAFEHKFIKKAPKIEHRHKAAPNLYNKPDQDVMLLLFSHEVLTPAGTILRLAWYCGLKRNEIAFLMWEHVDFNTCQLVLPDRRVPINNELESYLRALYKGNSNQYKYVLISKKTNAPLSEQNISVIARRTLNRYGQNKVRLNDLRIDFIVRSLKEKSWEDVSYISGVDLPSLRQHYLPYTEDSSVRDPDKPEITPSVRNELSNFMSNEGTSINGLAIRLVWQLGIPVSVVPLLTWGIIDFDKSIAKFVDRIVKIPNEILQILSITKNNRSGEYDNIILNESEKPTDFVFLQKTVQKSLIRNGIVGVTLPILQYDYWRNNYSELKALLGSRILESLEVINSEIYSVPKNLPPSLIMPPKDNLIEYLRQKGSSDSATLREALNLSDKELSLMLKGCLEKGEIVRVGARYFLPNMIVPREKQKEVILEYVKNNQPVSSTELTNLLGLVNRKQLYWIINPLLESGDLIRISRNNYGIKIVKTENNNTL